ncbi:MAG: cytochrome c [Gammaproteobacteria bacterium]|nr:cytochrome c [Gammaproteobacteria bacterium]
MRCKFFICLYLSCIAALIVADPALAFHSDVYQTRVPQDQLDAAIASKNPYKNTAERIKRGRQIYFGKGLCVTCHSKDGTGVRLPGHSPRDFTDARWQRLRSDGELMWVLKNGSPGTGMPKRVGTVISEEDGWSVIHFIRSFISVN